MLARADGLALSLIKPSSIYEGICPPFYAGCRLLDKQEAVLLYNTFTISWARESDTRVIELPFGNPFVILMPFYHSSADTSRFLLRCRWPR